MSQVLEPHSRRVDEGFSNSRMLAEVSLLPDKVRVASGRRAVAMAAGVIERARPGKPAKQVLVVVTSGWSVMCFDSNLKKLWENNLQVELVPIVSTVFNLWQMLTFHNGYGLNLRCFFFRRLFLVIIYRMIFRIMLTIGRLQSQ